MPLPKISSIRPVVLTQYRLVTDKRTDRQTDGRTDGWTQDDNKYRASIVSRGKNAKRLYGFHKAEQQSVVNYALGLQVRMAANRREWGR